MEFITKFVDLIIQDVNLIIGLIMKYRDLTIKNQYLTINNAQALGTFTQYVFWNFGENIA